MNKKAILAWLEKQGEHAKFRDSIQVDDKVTRNRDGMLVNLSQLKRVAKPAEKQGEQKPTDKVEPKFHEGDWVFIEEVKGYKNGPFQIKTVDSFGYSFDEYHTISFIYEDLLSKWTIQDAKDGDVLAADPWSDYPSSFVAIYKKQNEEDFDSYCFVGFDGKFYEGECGHSTEYIHPATKEQRDLLFQKMKKAGYIWDSKNKKLKGEEIDNIHNYLYGKQNLAWSEEDEARFKSCIKILQPSDEYDTINTKWLKSLKERVQPQDTAYYNPYKEVVESIAEMCKHYDKASHSGLRDFYDNIKVKCKDAKEYDSLFPQSIWKPSDEQMEMLNEVLNFAANHESSHWNDYIFGILNNLINQLKKLKS